MIVRVFGLIAVISLENFVGSPARIISPPLIAQLLDQVVEPILALYVYRGMAGMNYGGSLPNL